MHLKSIEERLNNPNVTKLEQGIRQIFVRFIADDRFADGRLLSISCGEGTWDYLALRVNNEISQIIATDIVDCPVMPNDEKLLKSVGNWQFVKLIPDEKLPFENEFFDVVYHLDVIEHTEKPFLFLQEQYRVLRQGGSILIGTPNIFRPANVLKLLLGNLRFPIRIGYNDELGDYIHLQEFHDAQLKLMLKECKFKNIKMHHVYFGLSNTNVCFSMFPKNSLGKTFSHYLLTTAEK